LGQALTSVYGGPGFEIVVVDQDGQVLVHPDPAYSRDIRTLDDRQSVDEVLGGHSGSGTRADPEGVEQLTAYAPLTDLGRGVLVSQPMNAAFGPARRQLVLEW